jgi:hypothetical protein
MILWLKCHTLAPQVFGPGVNLGDDRGLVKPTRKDLTYTCP